MAEPAILEEEDCTVTREGHADRRRKAIVALLRHEDGWLAWAWCKDREYGGVQAKTRSLAMAEASEALYQELGVYPRIQWAL